MRPEVEAAFERVLKRHGSVFEALAQYDQQADPDKRAWLGLLLKQHVDDGGRP